MGYKYIWNLFGFMNIYKCKSDSCSIHFVTCDRCKIAKFAFSLHECISYIKMHMLNEHIQVYNECLYEGSKDNIISR